MNIKRKTKNRNTTISLYWKCQLIGWCLVSIYWAYTVYTRDNYGAFYTFLNYLFDVSLGIFLTHLYKLFAIKSNWKRLSIKTLIIRIIPGVLVFAFLYVLISNLKWYAYWTWIAGVEKNLWESIIYWNPILITALRLMSIWILAYHLYHYYQQEMITANENAKLSLIAKQAQLDNLAAQLNPHFLFNSLNSIKSLVIENPNTARRAIDLLSDLLRSSLYEKDKGLINMNEELSLVNDYIELEKMRFEERLEIETTIDKSLNTFKIPTLSIQLLIENAIKHGIDLIVKGGTINLIIKRQSDFVEIIVRNPGRINTKNKVGLGLKNLQERLKIQYKNKAVFSLVEFNTNEVEAKIIIPFIDDENI